MIVDPKNVLMTILTFQVDFFNTSKGEYSIDQMNFPKVETALSYS